MYKNGAPNRSGRRQLIPLLPEFEIVNDLSVALNLVFFEVVEQGTALANEVQQPMPGRIVVGMIFQVLRQALNALREDGDLYFSGARVVGAVAVLVNQFLRLFFRNHCAVWVPL